MAQATLMLLRLPSGTPCSFFAANAAVVRCRNQPALLLGQGGKEVKHERVGIDSKLSHDEGDPLRHQSGDESDVT